MEALLAFAAALLALRLAGDLLGRWSTRRAPQLAAWSHAPAAVEVERDAPVDSNATPNVADVERDARMAATLGALRGRVAELPGVVGVTFALTGWRPGASWGLLMIGLAATSVADSAYAYGIATGTKVIRLLTTLKTKPLVPTRARSV